LRRQWTLRADGIKVPKVEGVQASQATGGSEMNRIVVGVDIAKRVFQLHWVEPETGEIVALQLKREKFLEHFANRSKCLRRVAPVPRCRLNQDFRCLDLRCGPEH
jgi:hypothetical protein